MTPRVTIVVPMYRCEATIEATIDSAQRQTFTDWELIAVDDGAPQARLLVGAYAARDPRIRLVGDGVNRGIASALNAGARAGRAALIAPLDADDVWAPSKIAEQVAAIDAAGPTCGLVYCGHRRIDDTGAILYDQPLHVIDGWGYLPLVVYNFIGNGSAILMRRAAYEDAGGYLEHPTVTSSLDVLLQLSIARRWRIACAPRYLVGYRLSRDSLSSRRLRSLGNRLGVLAMVAARHPETPAAPLRARRAETLAQMGCLEAAAGAPLSGLRALIAAAREDMAMAARGVETHLRRTLRKWTPGRGPKGAARAFGVADAMQAPRSMEGWRLRQLRRAAVCEVAFRASDTSDNAAKSVAVDHG